MPLTRIDNALSRLVPYEYTNWTCKGPLWTREMPQGCCSRNCPGHERSRGHCGGVHGKAACRTPGSQETWSNERRHPLLRNGRWRQGVRMSTHHPACPLAVPVGQAGWCVPARFARALAMLVLAAGLYGTPAFPVDKQASGGAAAEPQSESLWNRGPLTGSCQLLAQNTHPYMPAEKSRKGWLERLRQGM